MKRYEKYKHAYNHDKYLRQLWNREHHAGGFRCSHCKQFVAINATMGTANRNHCNWCLWSKHVDEARGDRRATCNVGMKPIGLTFKHDGYNRNGEIMLIHLCLVCQKISINRIARDDSEHEVLGVFYRSLDLLQVQTKLCLRETNIDPLERADEAEIKIRLFGKP